MESKSKEDILEYLAINHEYETAEELAEHCGIDSASVRRLLKANNLSLFSPTQAREEFARENYLKYDLPELAKIMGVAVSNPMLQSLYLRKEMSVPKVPAFPLIDENGLPINRYKLLVEKSLRRELDIAMAGEINQGKIKREPGVYDQSGSPYGVADELRNIHLRK